MNFIKYWDMVKPVPMLHELPIDEDEYKALRGARERLTQILDMEILYDQIVEACVETKSAMYDMSLRNISDCIIGDRIKGHNIRSKLNRLYFNVLNLSKLYLDKHFYESSQKSCNSEQASSAKKQNSFVKKITASDSLHSEVLMLREKIYGSNPDYRLGCHLRNYVQQNTLPVTSYRAGFKGHPDIQLKKSVFHIPLDKEKLSATGKISKSLLDQFGETIDLHRVMDGYIRAISEMHMLNRKLTEQTANESRNLIDAKVKEISGAFNASGIGAEVICVNGHSQISFDLSTSWFDLVHHLQNKNSTILDFSRFAHHPYEL